MSDTEWKVLHHDRLQQLADNLWHVEGDVPNMSLRRRMVIARLKSGDLVIHSAIALDDAGMAELESLGRPAWMVVPNGWHRLDAARFKARYPQIRVVCPEGSKKRVSAAVAVDGTYDDIPEPEPSDDSVRFEHFGGKSKMEGAMMVRSADGVSAVFADTIFNLPHGKGPFWFVYGRILGSTGGPRVTVIGRMFLCLGGGKPALRAWLERTADLPGFVRAIPCHGAVIDTDAPGALRAVAKTL